MLCDGVIWYRALFAVAPHAKTEPDALLLFCMTCFFAWVASLLWLAGRNDDDK